MKEIDATRPIVPDQLAEPLARDGGMPHAERTRRPTDSHSRTLLSGKSAPRRCGDQSLAGDADATFAPTSS